MSVLEDILPLTVDRPPLQRDALRRLVKNGELTDYELHALTEICKSAHGLAEAQVLTPSAKEQLPGARQRRSRLLQSFINEV
jgi:hypothetical protein